MMRVALSISFCILTAVSAFAQFSLIGDAEYMAGDCIRLTPDEPYTSGMAYHRRKLDLSAYFEIEFDIYFGANDELGADGIAFVMHNDPRGYEAFGFWGEGLGYGRIYPSVAVEFDTYQNIYRNDPACDHVAYLENGIVYQNDYWNNDDPLYNLEDDRLHNFRFRWDPSANTLTVMLDNNIVFQGTRDLVNEIFEGETNVIWGFTASTGRKHNLQYFCLRKWTNVTPYPLREEPYKTFGWQPIAPTPEPRFEYVTLPQKNRTPMPTPVHSTSQTVADALIETKGKSKQPLILTDDLVGESPQGRLAENSVKQ